MTKRFLFNFCVLSRSDRQSVEVAPEDVDAVVDQGGAASSHGCQQLQSGLERRRGAMVGTVHVVFKLATVSLTQSISHR